VLGPARKIIGEGLFRNSAFLIVNLVLASVCGYASLILLTHIFSVQDVGLSATAYSACGLIVSLALFGINYSVPRYLPTTTRRTELINTLLTAVILATLLGSAIFLALPFARNFFALGGWLFGVVFVVSAGLQGGEAVMQVVIVADRSSGKLLAANTVPSAAKLVAPPAFSSVGALGSYAARVLNDLFGFIIFAVVLIRRGHRFRPTLSVSATRDIRRFSAGMYVASIIGALPQTVLPLIVLSRVGSKGSAYWSVAIAIASFLFLLPSLINQALMPEVSARPTERRHLMRRCAILITVVVVPALIVTYFAAPYVLALFGHTYVAGSLVTLRWLTLAGFLIMLSYLTGAILFLAKKSFVMTVVNIVDAVIIFGLVGLWATNDQQIAIAWLIGEVANTILVSIFAFLALREVGGRWELLGEKQTVSVPAVKDVTAATAVTAAGGVSAASQQDALHTLVTLAEQQRTADLYKPYQYPVTDPQGLFQVAELAEAEGSREEIRNNGRRQDPWNKTPSRPGRSKASRTAPQQALSLLFSIAAHQRGADRADREKPPRFPEKRNRAPLDRDD
jgi:O-antigen/teichoic acid export membrane protein